MSEQATESRDAVVVGKISKEEAEVLADVHTAGETTGMIQQSDKILGRLGVGNQARIEQSRPGHRR